MAKYSLMRELWMFMRERKKWWLGPIFLVLVFLSLFVVFSEGSAVMPLIYALF